jgi:hypothetical protein
LEFVCESYGCFKTDSEIEDKSGTMHAKLAVAAWV